MTPEDLLERVETALEELVQAGERHGGLIPSVLSVETGEMPKSLPDSIPGQRDTDRSYPGCNLLFDQDLLRTFVAFPDDADRFDAAADRYVSTFVARCTDTRTGLFPWGDHAFWHLREQRLGDSYRHRYPDREPDPVHDQRLEAPFWLWERLAEADVDVVDRFARGLDAHWNDEARTAYDRHAYLDRWEHAEFPPTERACDFPRHAGYFALDLASASVLCDEPAHREQLRRFVEYWWPKRDDRGLLPYESSGNTGGSLEQTLSFACSLFEAASVLADDDPALAGTCRRRAETYLGGVREAVHRPAPLWGSGYPNAVRAATGLAFLSAWRHVDADWLLRRATAIGEAYRRIPFPETQPVRAMDPALVLELLVELSEVTGETAYLDRALVLSQDVVAQYLDCPIPRAGIGVEHYEAQLGSGTLLHALARTALSAEGRADTLPATHIHHPAGYERHETHVGSGWGS